MEVLSRDEALEFMCEHVLDCMLLSETMRICNIKSRDEAVTLIALFLGSLMASNGMANDDKAVMALINAAWDRSKTSVDDPNSIYNRMLRGKL